jgi:hypothetical protein
MKEITDTRTFGTLNDLMADTRSGKLVEVTSIVVISSDSHALVRMLEKATIPS